jgi:hypothetical protein
MADQATGERVSGKLTGWLKGLLTTILGLLSGAVLMYASPLIDRVVKPSKPLANFAVQPQGWQVTFQNRSTGGSEGWWDFGDGSALEPFVPAQQAVNHTYPKPGSYTAKLSLRNLIGEENERTVTVNLDDSAPTAPSIDSFEVVPVRPDSYAPATFRVLTKAKNADLCVWALGNEKPLEVNTEVSPERIVTFKHPGQHVIRLAVFHGKQAVEKNAVVKVMEPPKGGAIVALTVKREAVQVVSETHVRTLAVPFPSNVKDAVYPFSQVIPARAGFQITGAQVEQVVNLTNVKAEITPDHQQIKVTGQQVRPTGLLQLPRNQAPQAVVQVKMTEQRQMPATALPIDPVEMMTTVPGSTLLPVAKLDAGWVMKQQTFGVTLRDGDKVVWQSSQVPASGTVLFQNRPCQVSATLAGEQIRVDLTPVDPRSGLRPIGN